MPLGTLAQPAGISTPIAASKLPLLLRVNGNDLTGSAPIDGFSLTDMGFSAPQRLVFIIIDKANTIRPLLRPQALVIWTDEVNNRCLYQGYIKDVAGVATGPYATWTVTCNDLSEALDYARPIIGVDMGALARTDQAQIQSLVANYCYLGIGAGGFVQLLQPTMPANNLQQMTTLRNAIEATLDLTGITNAVLYVDAYGRMHTTTTGDVAAPYPISDVP